MKKKEILIFVLSVVFMLAMPLQSAADDHVRGDVDEDGTVTIGDVACLIDYLLNGQWDTVPERMTVTVGEVSFVMVKVEGGTYTTGAIDNAEAYEWELPAHEVTLPSYWIAETEVTQELWQAVMNDNPSHFKGDMKRPVESVSWISCQEFVDRLNALTGLSFSLPTCEQWDVAARGGNLGQGYLYAGSNNIKEVAWYDVNSYWVGAGHPNYGTHAVATKTPNELGLYDMSGNVHEWCLDSYSEYCNVAHENLVDAEIGAYHVLRGGCWSSEERRCRVSYFNFTEPGTSSSTVGLRLAMKAEQ